MICCRCNINKELSDFHKSKESSTGYKPACKACRKVEGKGYRQENTDKIKEQRLKKRDTYLAYYKQYYKNLTEEEKANERKRLREYHASHREKEKERSKKHYAENKGLYKQKYYKTKKARPEVIRARSAVKYAIDTNRIIKPSSCTKCDETKNLQGHHIDYSKPLDIIWLCKSCHCKEHLK